MESEWRGLSLPLMFPIGHNIRHCSLAELEEYFQEKGMPKFRAKQVYEWIWQKKAMHFADMTNLSKELRQQMGEQFTLPALQVDQIQVSEDGTRKFRFRTWDGHFVEGVLIPTELRLTACVSSQIGCSLNCKFCATGYIDRKRNLQFDEIYDEVVLINAECEKEYGRKLTNIVFMGMGEPLMNYPNVMKAIDMITSSEGLRMSPKRITVSTSGVSKMIKKMADDEVKFKLAVSLHSAIEEIRNEIMPFTKSFPLTELREALEYWYRKTKSKVTYEYVVWKGINDDKKSIDALVKFCKYVPCKVNLIEYNPIDDGMFQQASEEATNAYITALEKNNIVAKVRRSRGKDIDAACGQLANKS